MFTTEFNTALLDADFAGTPEEMLERSRWSMKDGKPLWGFSIVGKVSRSPIVDFGTYEQAANFLARLEAREYLEIVRWTRKEGQNRRKFTGAKP